MRSSDNVFLGLPLLRTPVTHTLPSFGPCNDLKRRLRLDSTSPTAPTTPSATASQAGDDDVEAGDDTGDDSLQNGSNAVNDCHEAGPEGLKEGFDLRLIARKRYRVKKKVQG